MLTETDEFAELFRGYFPFYILVFIPLFIIISPVSPVSGNHEFPAFRMIQYDLNGVPHGCRGSQINLEARAFRHPVTPRHCVLARLSDLNPGEVGKMKQGAGGLLVVIPQQPLSEKERQSAREVEAAFLEEELSLPVYFTPWTSPIEAALRDIESWNIDDRSGSTVDALINAVTANGYQVVVSAHKPSPRSDATIVSIQGKLSGQGVEDKLPTVAVVTHYDSFGIAPELPATGDGNASGVVILLELIRIFSNLYSNSRSHAPLNLLFLLSGGGKYNYQGSKKWLEDQLDGLEGSLLQEAQFVLCLDSLGQPGELTLHVSKPPREGSPAYLFYSELKAASNNSVSLLHKKINLAEEVFAWEHERYSMRRLAAMTLSVHRSWRDAGRRSSFSPPVDVTTVAQVTDAVAAALSAIAFNTTRVLPMSADSEAIRIWLDILVSPRGAPLLADRSNPLVKLLHGYMSRYLRQPRYSFATADKRDPEFLFYDVSQTTVNLYNVKPAVFDLVVSLAITAYLVVFYFALQQFDHLYSLFSPRIKTQ